MIKVEEKIKKIIADVVEVDLQSVNERFSFTEDLGADSLDNIEIMLRIEKECQIRITNGEMTRLKTVQNLIDFVKEKLLS